MFWLRLWQNSDRLRSCLQVNSHVWLFKTFTEADQSASLDLSSAHQKLADLFSKEIVFDKVCGNISTTYMYEYNTVLAEPWHWHWWSCWDEIGCWNKIEWSLDDELLKEIKMNRGHVDLRSDKLGLVARLSKSTSDGTVCPYVEGGSESEWYSCFLGYSCFL